jgi:hypothetical protein
MLRKRMSLSKIFHPSWVVSFACGLGEGNESEMTDRFSVVEDSCVAYLEIDAEDSFESAFKIAEMLGAETSFGLNFLHHGDISTWRGNIRTSTGTWRFATKHQTFTPILVVSNFW